ncbi:MAG TPA: phytanoyl-CoA dioxygenase family protein [Mycobacteriales bacterium]|nr:phytanoyl-CoA dioxygenase family protein [Mycobacteriales bacterium]
MPSEPTLQHDGYAVVRGVLPAEEIEALRVRAHDLLDTKGIDKAGGTVLPNAAVEGPSLAPTFSHPAIIEAVRSTTSLDRMLFTMEADVHRNYLASQWHKDTGEHLLGGGYFDTDWLDRDDCAVYKVALYLQDHPHRGALAVRPGSTRTRRVDSGSVEHLRVSAGDAVIFDVRLSHRGVAPSLPDKVILAAARISGAANADRRAARWRRNLFRLTGRPERLAIYFAFGAPNERSETFARRNLGRQLEQLGKAAEPLAPSLVEAFGAFDIGTVCL